MSAGYPPASFDQAPQLAPRPREHCAPRRVSGLGWLRLVLAAALVLPCLALLAIGWIGWRDAWSAAERELSRSAEAGAEYALRVTEGHRLLGDLVDDLLRDLPDAAIREREAALHAALRAMLPRFPLARDIVVMDRAGALLLMATRHPVPRDAAFADREWVRAFAATPPPPLHVSHVMTGRLDGGVFYAVSRQRGQGGTISVAVDPNALAAGFAAVNGGHGDVISLIREDGEILVRTPEVARQLPPVPATSPLRVAMAGLAARGIYLGRTLGLGAEPAGRGLLIAYRRLGTLPLYVTVGRSSALITAGWRDTLLRQLATGVPTALALIGLAWLALRRTREAEAAQAALHRVATERAAAEARRDAEARFRGVFESRVVGMAVFDAQAGRTLLANDRLLEMTGQSREDLLAGRFDWRRLTLPEHLPRDEAAVAQARQRGWWDPYEKDYLLPDGRRLPVRISSAPLPGEAGHLVVLVEDITERREAELRRELLIREVDHRAKNALATARAALRLTRAPDLDAFVREVDGRIGALAKAIALLAGTQWRGVGLEALLRGELAASIGRDGAGPSIALRGPPLTLASVAVQPLAMAVHELVTNATKYGALSVPGGRLAIAWSVAEGPSARLHLVWEERGGPAVPVPPAEGGFGTRVLQATLTRQLGGEVALRWDSAGLTCEILLPAARVLAAAESEAPPGREAPGAALSQALP